MTASRRVRARIECAHVAADGLPVCPLADAAPDEHRSSLRLCRACQSRLEMLVLTNTLHLAPWVTV